MLAEDAMLHLAGGLEVGGLPLHGHSSNLQWESSASTLTFTFAFF